MNALSSFIMESVLGSLELLRAVVLTGNFIRAGERLGLTQSGVSRAVARLEQQIGVRLFERNARAVTLTEEGRRFYETVSPLVGAIDEAVSASSGASAQIRGRLRVNADPLFARDVLAPRVERFLSAHRELELEVMVSDRVGDLVAEGFDVAIRFGDPKPSSLVAKRLFRTRIVTCATPAYLKTYGKPRRPEELSNGHSCIQFRDPQTGRAFEWEFHQGRRKLVVETKGRLYLNDGATALSACLASQGIGQMMELWTEEHLRTGTLVNLFPSWSDELFPLYAYYPSRQFLPARVRAFLDFISSELK